MGTSELADGTKEGTEAIPPPRPPTESMAWTVSGEPSRLGKDATYSFLPDESSLDSLKLKLLDFATLGNDARHTVDIIDILKIFLRI